MFRFVPLHLISAETAQYFVRVRVDLEVLSCAHLLGQASWPIALICRSVNEAAKGVPIRGGAIEVISTEMVGTQLSCTWSKKGVPA